LLSRQSHHREESLKKSFHRRSLDFNPNLLTPCAIPTAEAEMRNFGNDFREMINHCQSSEHESYRWQIIRKPSKIPHGARNPIARNQEFGLSTLHTMPKVQRLLHFKMITFRRRRMTLEGSLGWTGMETQTMVERPSVSFR
jgi:hypothetical protein